MRKALMVLAAMTATLSGPPAQLTVQGVDGGYPMAVTGTVVGGGGTIAVSNFPATQPISAISLPLPTGAALDATLTGGTAQIKITDGTNVASVKAASTAALATDKSLVCALSPNSPLPTGANIIGALTANQSVNTAQIGGTNTVNGGLAGTQGIGGTQANNAAITANPLLIGSEAITSTGAPGTVATSGNIRRSVSDTYGDQWMREGSPNQTGLWIAGLSTTLTQEIAAPAASTSIYVTDILCQSTTATASTCQLKWGTGSNCGTGTVAGPIYTAPLNTANPTETHAPHYIVKVPAASALCLVCGSATNTCNIALGAYVAQ